MFQHVLKVHPEQLRLLELELKRFEFRKDDRVPAFAAGDELLLYGWDPKRQERTGDWLRLRVVHVSRGGEFGLPDGFCAMSVALAAVMHEQAPKAVLCDREALVVDRTIAGAGVDVRDCRVHGFGEKPVEIEAPRSASDCADCRDADPPGECAKCRDAAPATGPVKVACPQCGAFASTLLRVAGVAQLFCSRCIPSPTVVRELEAKKFAAVNREALQRGQELEAIARRVLARQLRENVSHLAVFAGTVPAGADAPLPSDAVELFRVHAQLLEDPGDAVQRGRPLSLVSSFQRFALHTGGVPSFLRVIDRDGVALVQATCGKRGSDVELDLATSPSPIAPRGAWPAGAVVTFREHGVQLLTN